MSAVVVTGGVLGVTDWPSSLVSIDIKGNFDCEDVPGAEATDSAGYNGASRLISRTPQVAPWSGIPTQDASGRGTEETAPTAMFLGAPGSKTRAPGPNSPCRTHASEITARHVSLILFLRDLRYDPVTENTSAAVPIAQSCPVLPLRIGMTTDCPFSKR